MSYLGQGLNEAQILGLHRERKNYGLTYCEIQGLSHAMTRGALDSKEGLTFSKASWR